MTPTKPNAPQLGNRGLALGEKFRLGFQRPSSKEFTLLACRVYSSVEGYSPDLGQMMPFLFCLFSCVGGLSGKVDVNLCDLRWLASRKNASARKLCGFAGGAMSRHSLQCRRCRVCRVPPEGNDYLEYALYGTRNPAVIPGMLPKF